MLTIANKAKSIHFIAAVPIQTRSVSAQHVLDESMLLGVLVLEFLLFFFALVLLMSSKEKHKKHKKSKDRDQEGNNCFTSKQNLLGSVACLIDSAEMAAITSAQIKSEVEVNATADISTRRQPRLRL